MASVLICSGLVCGIAILYFPRSSPVGNSFSLSIIEFRKEKIQSLRNDYTKIYYPYISINNETEIHRLSNANSWSKKYKINETIEVFNYGDKWIDWNTYNKGFYKLIPNF